MTIHETLLREHAPVVLLNQQAVLDTKVELTIGEDVAGRISTGDFELDLGDVSAFYPRPFDSRILPDVEAAGAGSPAWRHALEVEEAMLMWAEVTPALVVNPWPAMMTNMSKPFQSVAIRAVGFAIPDTLITSDPEAAAAFWRKHGDVIYKSISGARSIVARLGASKAAYLDDVRWCPTQFQQCIAGREYRVHVVGDDVFATEIISEAADYRFGAAQGQELTMRGCALPDDCADRCRKLTERLGLVLAGIDLRQGGNGTWYCFEANPSPGFTYYQRLTGQPIDAAIARLLMAGRGSSRALT